MSLREFVFKTASDTNLLCQFTKRSPQRWILIHLFRERARGPGRRALFVIHAEQAETERFLRGEFGKRYGTFEMLHQEGRITSVEVSDYAMPAYRGLDPVEMTIRMLGPDVIFEPVLVHGGYIHVKVVAAQRGGGGFRELTHRVSQATDPSEFQLMHTGVWDPVRALLPPAEPLSPKQQATLAKAIALGYYETPRACTLEEVAKAFGVSKAAVHKHLQAAESKLIRQHAP